jgi:hypothetical protein
MPDDRKRTPNKLINESSLYLLQHAYNPVDWYPWGNEAFEKAKSEDKPVFLSIGYSTCHWCHVMEKESFEDEEVARVFNKDYVCIKVDREQRADIDAVYMRVCQMLTGSGGWPLSIFLTPDQKPFYASTYIPKDSKYNMTGLIDLLQMISTKWKNNKTELINSGSKITELLNSQTKNKNTNLIKNIENEIIQHAYMQLAATFDEKNGGFGTAPKFPSPQNILFLIHYHQFKGSPQALEMAEKTLLQMYRGGIFDHIGFGFCRYSTDPKWLVPHFEKMLYDNALLLICYLDLFSITHKIIYKIIALKIMDYILRELTDKTGAFYSAQDADSAGIEGSYYLFSKSEIIDLLGEKEGKYFCNYFNITDQGHFENLNIPNLLNNRLYDSCDNLIEELIVKVFAYRKNRMPLMTDDKIITSWNCMMIAAFAKAYKILGQEKYLMVAINAQKIIETNLTAKNGLLYASMRNNKISGPGHLDDYAYYLFALIELYEVTFEPYFLEKSIKIYEMMQEQFLDRANGGYFLSGKDSEALIARPKETYDGAVPSANSVLAYTLAKLSSLTGKTEIENAAAKQADFMASCAKEYPAGFNFSNIAFMKRIYPSKEVVAVINSKEEAEQIKKIINRKFHPNLSALIKKAGSSNLDKLAEFSAPYELKNKKTTFYVCENNTCEAPMNDISLFERKINEL